MPCSLADERLLNHFRTLFPLVKINTGKIGENDIPLNFQTPIPLFDEYKLQELWQEAQQRDTTYHKISEALQKEEKQVAADTHVKTSLSECHLDERGLLCFRKRIWIPESEPLRTRIIQ